jgi:hypothetical protein
MQAADSQRLKTGSDGSGLIREQVFARQDGEMLSDQNCHTTFTAVMQGQWFAEKIRELRFSPVTD